MNGAHHNSSLVGSLCQFLPRSFVFAALFNHNGDRYVTAEPLQNAPWFTFLWVEVCRHSQFPHCKAMQAARYLIMCSVRHPAKPSLGWTGLPSTVCVSVCVCVCVCVRAYRLCLTGRCCCGQLQNIPLGFYFPAFLPGVLIAMVDLLDTVGDVCGSSEASM